jgi:hypothetical protein
VYVYACARVPLTAALFTREAIIKDGC